MPEMNEWQRAKQIWSVLVFAAREQKVLSYEMIAQMTGMANECGRELGHIYHYCENQRRKGKKLPSLNLIAVQKASGRPGHGCPEEFKDLPAEQSRVFLFNWLEHGVPTVEDFQKARQEATEKESAVLA
ncbi:MAG TPA: hypothetical protein VGU63_03710 [Candidatus Acidoferrales bacterium]|nr:hypothetical protein [Candidatus Acidoferrales bacterium]